MLLSMTGYGRAKVTYKDKNISIEVRSLNSKFTDLRFRMPQVYKEKESEIRKMITKSVDRGKADLNIDVNSTKGNDDYALNSTLFKKYYVELTNISRELNIPHGDIIQSILRIPNVVGSADNNLEDEEWEAVRNGIREALNDLKNFRMSDGSAMETDLRLRVNNILEGLNKLDPHEEHRAVQLRQRLHTTLEEHLGKDKIDENRFEQEILFYLEKMDITEEKVRLEQHCHFFLEQLGNKKQQKGRKLSFISQEMGREINTLGAKAYSSDIQKIVVVMKDELEKIKEQVANIV